MKGHSCYEVDPNVFQWTHECMKVEGVVCFEKMSEYWSFDDAFPRNDVPSTETTVL